MNRDVVFARMDRLGDLILTLPCDQIDTQTRAHWFVTTGLGSLLDCAKPRRSFTEYSREFSFWQLIRMVRELRQRRPDAIVLFHTPWWVALAAWLARIPLRAGRLSQWHSFLFLNRRLRQKRHLSERHELEYNQELTRLIEPATESRHLLPLSSLALRLEPPSVNLHKWGLVGGRYYVVHPGMGGSALNWPVPSYAELIRLLAQYHPVVVTGTPGDAPYLSPLKQLISDLANITWLDGKLSLQELIAVDASAAAVVAPSTGAVHIAASAGAPTVGLYSPVVAHSAKRWGPIGPIVRVIEPSAQENRRSMNTIQIDTVFQTVLSIQRVEPT